jgi:parvulin-like peptidyl-prolyl isomerase
MNKSICLLAFLIAFSSAAARAAAEPDDSLATVNGEAVRQADFNKAWAAFLALKQRTLKPEQMTAQWQATAKEFLLNDIVVQRLLLQEAKKRGVVAAKKDVDEAVRKAKAQFKTPEDFRKALAKEKITEKRFQEDIERQLQVTAMTDAVIKEGIKAPSEEQVRQLFEIVQSSATLAAKPKDARSADIQSLARQLKLRTAERARFQHILFKVDPKATAEQSAAAAKKAGEVKAQLDKGADFAELAKQYSDDKATSQRGGEAGTIVRGQMIKEFDDAVFSLPVGKISDVVKTKVGYHIIRVEERKVATPLTYEDAKPVLTDFLLRTAAAQEYAKFVDGLKKSAVIYLRANFTPVAAKPAAAAKGAKPAASTTADAAAAPKP